MLVILVPAISHAQSVTIGPGSEGIRLTLEKLTRRDAFFPEAMSVHLIVENLDAKPAEQLTIHCRAVDVDGFTLERSRPRDGTVSNLQPAEKLRIVVSIPEHASTNKVVCNINYVRFLTPPLARHRLTVDAGPVHPLIKRGTPALASVPLRIPR